MPKLTNQFNASFLVASIGHARLHTHRESHTVCARARARTHTQRERERQRDRDPFTHTHTPVVRGEALHFVPAQQNWVVHGQLRHLHTQSQRETERQKDRERQRETERDRETERHLHTLVVLRPDLLRHMH